MVAQMTSMPRHILIACDLMVCSLRAATLARRSPATSKRPRRVRPEIRSEIRRVRHRNTVIEQHPIALGADLLAELLLHAPITSHSGPRLVVSVRVLHGED